MFRNKRSTNVLAGRLPLRDVDFNESILPSSDGLGVHKAKPAETKVKKPTEDPISSSQVTKKRTEIGNCSIRPLNGTRIENSVVRQTLHTPRVTQSPLPSSNTPSCTYPTAQDHGIRSNHKNEPEHGLTPSSTFPVSNPQSCVSATPHCTEPPTPDPSSENPCISIHRSKSVPQRLSSSTATHEDRGPPTLPPVGKPPLCQLPGQIERKASSGSPPALDSGVVMLNGQKFKKLSTLGSGGSSKVSAVLSPDGACWFVHVNGVCSLSGGFKCSF